MLIATQPEISCCWWRVTQKETDVGGESAKEKQMLVVTQQRETDVGDDSASQKLMLVATQPERNGCW